MSNLRSFFAIVAFVAGGNGVLLLLAWHPAALPLIFVAVVALLVRGLVHD